ncbi:hypothetical protein [Fulvivirga sediminis]|uniref:Tryptophan-rich sensory protein n=1 Tax=Fulvivirga sediminis TaxID=2803949 RepID=A0A937FAI9_9BACT|nr:hypothetical protein [Fulvivirga sediminis]MBL3657315.1 hypothetical protein [Fulvivirga sediminis]
MIASKNILSKFARKWQFILWFEIILIGLSVGLGTYLFFYNLTEATISILLALTILSLIIRPWGVSKKIAARYINDHYLNAEYSSDLLLERTESLTTIGQLQQNRVFLKLTQERLLPPHHLFKVLGLSVVLILSCWGISSFLKHYEANQSIVQNGRNVNNEIELHPVETETKSNVDSLEIASVELFINYPSYTKMPTQTQVDMNAEILEGSSLTWKLAFNKKASEVALDWNGRTYTMIEKDKYFYRSITPKSSGFYQFVFKDVDENELLSDLYNLHVINDQKPIIQIQGLNQYTSFEYNSNKNVFFEASIQDDFGINQAYIIATVSQGEGESVKFREERWSFDNQLVKGDKEVSLNKTIQFDHLDISPGDELYFYVEAIDNKLPDPQRARSETYFIEIKDTIAYEYTMDASLGADVMPEYFRSQRQIIIDSEKLINNGNNLTNKIFKDKINNIAFDQKALRLKYGQFLGEEAESGIDVSPEEQVESMMQNDGKDDALTAYMHDHDGGEGEGEVGEYEHDKSHAEHEHSENNLETYTHNHDNREEATFYTVSVKTKLKQALSEMWNAELYLRLAEPSKSLPYQYKALKLIKEVKNDDRIYVHRIGFDPPPIKEKSRLSGDIDHVNSHSVNNDFKIADPYEHIKRAIPLLHDIINKEKTVLDKAELETLKYSAEELAQQALLHPGKYLHSLQNLKRITQKGAILNNHKSVLQMILKDFTTVLPDSQPSLQSKNESASDWNVLLINEMRQVQHD